MGYLTGPPPSGPPGVGMGLPPKDVQVQRVQAKAARLRAAAVQARSDWLQAREQLERLATQICQLGVASPETEDRLRAGTTELDVSPPIASTQNTRCAGDNLAQDRQVVTAGSAALGAHAPSYSKRNLYPVLAGSGLMDLWLHRAQGYWYKEADLPIGHLVAEIRKQVYLPLYSTRLAVTLPDGHIPQQMTKSGLGLLTLGDAQLVCNRLVAELMAINSLAQSRNPQLVARQTSSKGLPDEQKQPGLTS